METTSQLKQRIQSLKADIAQTISNTKDQRCTPLLVCVYNERIWALEQQLNEAEKKLEKY